MKTNQLGSTGIRVSEVSFGCSGVGNLYRAISEQAAQEVLGLAWGSGIRYFDTAPYYGRGLSEVRLGAFLQDKSRDQFAVSTKVGRVLTPGQQAAEADGFVSPLPNDIRYDYSGDGIEESFEQSCAHLGMNYIDILYVHDIGTNTHGAENTAHLSDLLSTGLDRLQHLKDTGRIGAFGLGVNENQVCLDVLGERSLDVILLAGRLTLLDRSAEVELVPLCRHLNTSLVLGGIFNSGILATGPIDGASYDYAPASPDILTKVCELERTATGLGLPLATAAIHFARTHKAAASVLLGTAKTSSLQRNIDALATQWSAEARQAFM